MFNNKELEILMREAIEYERPWKIDNVCLPVWNQPFFYKIDKAKALTLSYNPTDKGARTNYPSYVSRYKSTGFLPTDTIMNILYNFQKEEYWRKNYDIIFDILDIPEVAHMDVSFFPYISLLDYKKNEYLDDTYKFLLKAIGLLTNQLKYIFIDGARNKDILYKIKGNDYIPFANTRLPVNSSGKDYELSIYKHTKYDLYLIYFGCFLYGSTCPAIDKVKNIAKYIKSVTQ